MVVHIHRDKTLLAHMGKKKELVRILSITETGAVAHYELVDEPGVVYMPLIVNGRNIEEFKILGEQLSLF
ncbi:hypothetical protein RBU61_08420 [Tissierella sp. MB52-C2]|uniref:hypothetical protein n=1 Tax=Tissierella sp. MB52-C2 TaxID=3070999 RepID=UPI00280AF22F|nr:hypothetical protein [Tissierella sp. MB52-C2]WMM26689.1 hypothetical protein RBU61_08420 [Tissierella sp. MB52-C2]